MTTLYVFVAGPNGSGKSRFLRSLGDPDGFWVDEQEGLEYRHLIVDSALDVNLFCSVDASRFDHLLQIPQRDLLGHIVFVDSTDPDTWSEARVMIANCRGYALLPTVIAANKQDLSGAYTAEQVGAWIGMGSMMKVLPCVATDQENARNLFLQLLYSVNNEIDRLDALTEQIVDQMQHDLGIGLGAEDRAFFLERLAQLAKVLDDAVMHDGDALGRVRVRIVLGGLAVGRPAGVTDAGVAGQRI